MRLALFEDQSAAGFVPIAWMRPVCELLCGQFSLRERLLRGLSVREWGAFVRPFLAETYREAQPKASINDLSWLAHESTLLINARWLPDVEGLISGSVVEQGRRCGKEGCRCATGELHGPYTYVVLPRVKGRTRTVYVPAGAADAVREGAAVSARVREALEEISAINVELLARGELG